MKYTKLVLTLCVVISSFSLFAQRGRSQEQMDLIRTKKISFITEYLDLTPEEAQSFWPLFNEMEKKKAAMFSEYMKVKEELKEGDDGQKISEAKSKEMLDKLAIFWSEESQLKIEYNERFLEVLSPQKTLRLFMAEDRFRHSLMKEYRNKGHKNN